MAPSLKKILVVDDSELLHRMYDLVLRRYRDAGAELLHARNGSEGLNIVRSTHEIDLVLLDVNMPVMNGLQLLSALKIGGYLARLRVLMVSSEGSEQDVQIAMEKGAIGYVTKPFAPSDLHEMIDRHFSRANALSRAGAMV